MQYIECIHCQKRYPANQKMRDAVTKKVRCTECGKSFPIVVYEVKSEAPPKPREHDWPELE
jgi:DNA-directed RNA polymerase subunit RPC12/RpoP